MSQDQVTPVAEPIKEPVDLFKFAMEFVKFCGSHSIACEVLNTVENLEILVTKEKQKAERAAKKKVQRRTDNDEEEEEDY